MFVGQEFDPTISPLRSMEEEDVRVKIDEIADALSNFPAFSVFSTADGPNTSGITARRGTLGLEIGSSATTPVWICTSSGTTGWSALSWI
jgi:hypothetical protein